MSTGTALAVTTLVLVVVNVWVHLAPQRVHVVTGPLAAVLLLLVARDAGLSWDELGLARDDLREGVLYGAAAATAVALVYVVAVAVPFTRGAFRDTRYRVGSAAAVFTAVVTIPLATIVFEEVAFRSVLWGLLVHDFGAPTALAVTALLFGLWHVLPGLKMTRTNLAVDAESDGRPARIWLTVLGTVAFTALAGLVLGELRRRSGSLVAPMILHWSTNGLGVLAAARVWAMESGRSGRPG